MRCSRDPWDYTWDNCRMSEVLLPLYQTIKMRKKIANHISKIFYRYNHEISKP